MTAPWKFLPCEDCCEGGGCASLSTDPTNGFRATASGIIANVPPLGCADCSDMNADYDVEAHNPFLSPCLWDFVGNTEEICTGIQADEWDVDIEVTVTDIAGDTRITVDMLWTSSIDGEQGMAATFIKDFVGLLDGTSLVAVDIPQTAVEWDTPRCNFDNIAVALTSI